MSDEHKPLKLTWQVQNWAERSHPAHLDALVRSAMISEGMADGRYKEGPHLSEVAQGLDIPIGQAEQGGKIAPMASAILPQEIQAHFMRLWTTKQSIDTFVEGYDANAIRFTGRVLSKEDGRIKPFTFSVAAGGPFKSKYQFTPVSLPKCLVAYCVGDRERLESLLAPESGFVRFIGASSRLGLGRVIDFKIEEDEAALSMWKMRVMPWPVEGYIEVEMASSYPYWSAANRGQAWVPEEVFGCNSKNARNVR